MSSSLAPLPKSAPNTRRTLGTRSKRWLPWLGALVLVALIALGFRPQPLPVETAVVAEGTLRATINEEGKTRIRQRYVVSAPVSGRLRRIDLKAGAEVQAGQSVVAVIDALPAALLDPRARALAEARRDTAVANLEKARKSHEYARSELLRYQSLFGTASISVQELEPIQWREAAAAKDLAAAESALRQAEAELLDFSPGPESPGADAAKPVEVRSPAGTRVLRVFEESARVVTAGTPLLEVGDPTDLEVVIEVLSRDGAAIPAGARVELEQWGGDQTLEGRVRLVEPAAFTKVSALGVEEQRVNVIADLITPAGQRANLGDQFRVEAHIVVWEAEHTLKVAAGALFRKGPAWAAFVIRNGRAELRAVQTGRSSGAEMQVRQGLAKGDTVILYPGDRVQAGKRVRPIQVSP